MKAVTLNLQTAAAYDGGKTQADLTALATKGAAVKSASVGENAYYFVLGNQVGLWVKKGGISFKVAVYAKLRKSSRDSDLKTPIERALNARELRLPAESLHS